MIHIFFGQVIFGVFHDIQQIHGLKTIPALHSIASGHKMHILNAPPSKKNHKIYTSMKDPARKA